jgi:hypothetical protein
MLVLNTARWSKKVWNLAAKVLEDVHNKEADHIQVQDFFVITFRLVRVKRCKQGKDAIKKARASGCRIN